MTHVLILDDDKMLIEHYKKVVEDALVDCKVFTATAGKIALSIVNSHRIDLMLLDMELDDEKKVLGLDYANMFSLIQPNIDYMIISGYSDYLKAAGDVEPFYYFMKPVNDQFLSRKLLEWEMLNQKEEISQKNLKLQTENGMAIVPCHKICYIEKMNRKVKIVTFTKEYICRESLRTMLGKLDSNFVHTHQSFLVNIDHIESVEPQEDRTWTINFKELEDKAILSRYKAKAFFKQFSETN